MPSILELFFQQESMQVVATSALIFCARIADVSIGTLRIVSVSKGRRYLAPILGFIEILIWLIAIRQVMVQPQHFSYYIAYAGGFALGNFVGIRIEEHLALGYQAIRIITHQDPGSLLERMRLRGFGYTQVKAEGSAGGVQIIFAIIKRKYTDELETMIMEHNPQAFYSLEEVQLARAGIFPPKRRMRDRMRFDFRRMFRKGK